MTSKWVAVAVVPIIAVSAILGVYLSSLPSNSGSVKVSSTTTNMRGANSTLSTVHTTSFSNATSSGITNITTSAQGALSLLHSQVSRNSSDNSWEFSVFGYVDTQNLDLNSTLTYLSPQTKVFQLQNPIDWLTVTYQNGSTVYTWAVPGALAIENVTQNEEFINFDQIPLNVMHNAGTYTIHVMPWVTTGSGTSLQQQLEVNITVISSGFTPAINTTQSTSVTTFYSISSSSGIPNNLIILDASNGSSACASIRENQSITANWSKNVCTLIGSDNMSNFVLRPGITLDIVPGATLVLNGGGFGNYGTIINNGTIDINTSLTTYGVIDNAGLIIANSTVVSIFDANFLPNGGTFENYGNFLIVGHLTYYLPNSTFPNGTTYVTGGSFTNGGILNNYGTINSTGTIWNGASGFDFNSQINNYGIIRNLMDGRINNNYTFANGGVIYNSGAFENTGVLGDYCGGNFMESGGTFSGNTIVVESCTTATVQMTTTIKDHSST